MKIIRNKEKRIKFNKQDKGHFSELKNFVNSIINIDKNQFRSLISFDELYLTSVATFKVIESLQTGTVIKL